MSIEKIFIPAYTDGKKKKKKKIRVTGLTSANSAQQQQLERRQALNTMLSFSLHINFILTLS